MKKVVSFCVLGSLPYGVVAYFRCYGTVDLHAITAAREDCRHLFAPGGYAMPPLKKQKHDRPSVLSRVKRPDSWRIPFILL